MPLASGQKLGAYEVVGAIGAGGMGEVYRARDPNLDREVAIKVLPKAFAADRERVTRFEREAKLLAVLNHPGIATVHGFEETEGKRFLVMELVEGETLAERIGRGAIAVDEALPLFHQIAEALEAAHEKGVVHRDLKPLNVKITPEEKVKVLDFGLAKLVEAEPPSSDALRSQSPTLVKGTLHGAILGTASYMSPEQARGMLVDRRTDIWAFGCCLYEALSGKKAFEGESVTDVLAAVVKSEPDWRRLPKDIPWRIRDLLGRCLRKDPAKRLRDISAARLDIEDSLATPALAESAKPAWTRVVVAGLLGMVVGAAFLRNPAPGPPPVQRFTVQVPIDFQAINNLSVSPDGNVLAFSGRNGQIGIRRFDDLETRFLEGTRSARRPFFSPDGRWVGFFAGEELKRVSLSGGPPVTLARTRTPWRATWSADGAIYVPSAGTILRVPDSGGKGDVVLHDAQSAFTWANALPNGRSLLVGSSNGGASRVEVVTAATGERKVVINDAAAPRYVPTGHIVFFRSGSLFAVPFDLERLVITGEAVPVIEGVRNVGSTGADYDVSLSGSLVYKPVASGKNGLFWVGRSGKATPLIESEPGSPFIPHPRLSPDGRRVAVPVSSAGGNLDLWMPAAL
jgi:serine/threonine-protein kinase